MTDSKYETRCFVYKPVVETSRETSFLVALGFNMGSVRWSQVSNPFPVMVAYHPDFPPQMMMTITVWLTDFVDTLVTYNWMR